MDATRFIVYSWIDLLVLARQNDRFIYGLPFLAQLWVNGSVNYAGATFGARKYINCGLIFAFGLGGLIKYTSKYISSRKWKILFAILTIWNGIFILQYSLHLIPRDRPLTWKQLVVDKILLPVELIKKYLN